MPPIDSDLILREWIKTATPGTIIAGKFSRRRYVVTATHTLNGLGDTPQPTNTTLSNCIANYTITLPSELEEPKPNRPQPGERVKVTIEGVVTKWVASDRRFADHFEIQSDDGRYTYFNAATKPTVEVIKPPLPTEPGTVLRNNLSDIKMIRVGKEWRQIKGGQFYADSIVQTNWDGGFLELSTL